ncbi:MAG: DUF695 domain-containing protein [Sulfurovum sp.]|nr:DUF695 domain-containing protein [Sulfurovum sp.]MCB4763845.1 DUF695 domain-containing protein [Sulfurovum sp.]MCB4775021.1 DUF695 domain-containing protein [Sulfurovum sp.]MCB4779196.1 DUF695 domain-containing protein [Sulfurovum sp.]MCB4781684.1 DUF695 domain-containing protein [Sulfurovum sp.]
MQEYWELYMKNMEGHPTSVQFNAGISMETEELQHTHPIVAFVKVKLKSLMSMGFCLTRKNQRFFLWKTNLKQQ